MARTNPEIDRYSIYKKTSTKNAHKPSVHERTSKNMTTTNLKTEYRLLQQCYLSSSCDSSPFPNLF